MRLPTMRQPQIIHSKVPRYIRRIIHDTSQCHYQREEYADSASRDERYRQLRHIPGIVRYSDSGAVGLVYVVAWPRPHGGIDKGTDGGMTPANGKATPHSDTVTSGNSQKSGVESVSMETATGKIMESDTETVSMEMVTHAE